MSTRVSAHTNAGVIRLYVLDCASCGVVFAITEDYEQRRRNDGVGFRCPNGHSNAWSEDEADRLRKQLKEQQAVTDRMRTRWLAEQDQRRAAEDEAALNAARERRLRWRIANGVCPCCSRTFPALAAHVGTKHPEQLTQQLEDLSTAMRHALAVVRRASDEDALVDAHEHGLDHRSLRALERRHLVEHHWSEDTVGWSLTDEGWPVAERAASEVSR